MKVCVLFALFAVPITSDLCAKEGANLAAAAEAKKQIVMVANSIFGHCYSLDINKLAFSGDCLPLFEQAFCYRQLAKVHYEDLDVVSYGDLADDIPNIQHLGEVSCERVRGCYNSLRDAFTACVDEPYFDDFVGKALEKVGLENRECRYDKRLVEVFGTRETDTIVGELVNILRNRFRNVDDVQLAIADLISDDIISDAEAAAMAISDVAVAWCDGNCKRETGLFLEQLFNHMDRRRGCNDALMFCGQCKRRADTFLYRNAVPCACLDNLVVLAMEVVYYVREQYYVLEGKRLFCVTVQNFLSDYAVAEVREIKERALKELECLVDSYAGSHNNCGPAA